MNKARNAIKLVVIAPGARRRRAAGFTLVELLVVFALLALIVGLVPIAFNRLNESAQYAPRASRRKARASRRALTST